MASFLARAEYLLLKHKLENRDFILFQWVYIFYQITYCIPQWNSANNLHNIRLTQTTYARAKHKHPVCCKSALVLH